MMLKSLKNTIQSLEKNEISIKELSQEFIKNILIELKWLFYIVEKIMYMKRD